ncbi:uncharacterized protein [Rutidosis leptorrhynchoides]|uniref:uncharacterized protein n=1 Tax=Rutidosis leptorrhynchoides TaxID=125765 RepID=UPI003A99B8D6
MADSSETSKPFSVLFVCLGNICRSPAAEGVFKDLVKKRGLDSNFIIDSAGTINYHEGNLSDPRMREASKKRGIEITSRSRPIRPSDFVEFDLILAMDNQNREDILEAFNRWRFRDPIPEDAHKKVRLMCSYCKKHDETEVPDPYYGGPQGFEKVLDLLEDGCESLLDSIITEKNKNPRLEKLSRSRIANLPGVSVIMPLKGFSEQNLPNWRSQTTSLYDRPLEFLFVVGSREDSVYHAVSRLLSDFKIDRSKDKGPKFTDLGGKHILRIWEERTFYKEFIYWFLKPKFVAMVSAKEDR